MSTLSVSTYSVREELGPVQFDFVDPAGTEHHISFPFPRLLELSEFPARAVSAFGVSDIGSVAFQFAGLDDPELDRFHAALQSNGVGLVDVSIDAGDLLEPDDDRRAADVAEIGRWIERFAGMGARFVRVNPGSPFSPHQGGEPPAHLVRALVEVAAIAKAHGTRLLVENHGGPSSDPVWMNRLLDLVGRDACGLLLDLGNFDALLGPTSALFFGDAEGKTVDPAEVFAGLDLEPLYAGIASLADRAEVVHVKAHQVSADGAVGPVDLPRALGILLDHGFDGAFTVEYEGTGGDPWAKTARVLDVVRETLAGVRA
jgi:sugar phosphate isomerase/epimerase